MSVPIINLKGTYTVRLCDPDSSISFSPAKLCVRDNIYGGASRYVMIKYAMSDNNITFLKTDHELFKTEFEDMFFLEPGCFIKGRTISLSSDSVEIQQDNIKST